MGTHVPQTSTLRAFYSCSPILGQEQGEGGQWGAGGSLSLLTYDSRLQRSSEALCSLTYQNKPERPVLDLRVQNGRHRAESSQYQLAG